MQTKDHAKYRFFNKIEEESVGNEFKISSTQVSPRMNCLVNTENKQLLMPQNNLIQNHSSLLTNCNMMNMNNQYPFLLQIICLLVQWFLWVTIPSIKTMVPTLKATTTHNYFQVDYNILSLDRNSPHGYPASTNWE